jgi:hypothetical protein
VLSAIFLRSMGTVENKKVAAKSDPEIAQSSGMDEKYGGAENFERFGQDKQPRNLAS